MHSCSESKSDSQAPFLNKRRKQGHRSPGGISALSSSGEGQLPEALAFFLLFSWVYLVRLQETCLVFFFLIKEKSLRYLSPLSFGFENEVHAYGTCWGLFVLRMSWKSTTLAVNPRSTIY